MRVTQRRLVCLFATTLLAGLALSHEGQSQSGEHGDGHAEMHHIYKGWHSPSNPGVDCCNDGDCRPTRAKQDEGGNWLAWNGHKWLLVPQRALMPPDVAGDGRSHICERQEFIYCFTPAQPKM
jgi:hypothetical protein